MSGPVRLGSSRAFAAAEAWADSRPTEPDDGIEDEDTFEDDGLPWDIGLDDDEEEP